MCIRDSRLYDESQKLFTMGHLHRVMPMLIEFGIWKQLFADISPEITQFMERAAKNTDQDVYKRQILMYSKSKNLKI